MADPLLVELLAEAASAGRFKGTPRVDFIDADGDDVTVQMRWPNGVAIARTASDHWAWLMDRNPNATLELTWIT